MPSCELGPGFNESYQTFHQFLNIFFFQSLCYVKLFRLVHLTMYFMQLQMSECCIHLSINHRFNQYNMFCVVFFFHPTIFFATMGINTVLRGDWAETHPVSWEHPLSWEEILCCDETLPVFWKETHLASWEDIYLVSSCVMGEDSSLIMGEDFVLLWNH